MASYQLTLPLEIAGTLIINTYIGRYNVHTLKQLLSLTSFCRIILKYTT